MEEVIFDQSVIGMLKHLNNSIPEILQMNSIVQPVTCLVWEL